MNYDEIDKKTGLPLEEISCPGCGQKYGHHGTKVCPECEECSSCILNYDHDCKAELVSAKEFIIKPITTQEGLEQFDAAVKRFVSKYCNPSEGKKSVDE